METSFVMVKTGHIHLVLVGLMVGWQSGPTLQKIVYEISKSFNFIETIVILCGFSDHKDFVIYINIIKLAIFKEK